MSNIQPLTFIEKLKLLSYIIITFVFIIGIMIWIVYAYVSGKRKFIIIGGLNLIVVFLMILFGIPKNYFLDLMNNESLEVVGSVEKKFWEFKNHINFYVMVNSNKYSITYLTYSKLNEGSKIQLHQAPLSKITLSIKILN